jgi:hypothetical protein
MDDADGVRTSESVAVPAGLMLSETVLEVEASYVLFTVELRLRNSKRVSRLSVSLTRSRSTAVERSLRVTAECKQPSY